MPQKAVTNVQSILTDADAAVKPDPRSLSFDDWCAARGIDYPALDASDAPGAFDQLADLEDEYDRECEAAANDEDARAVETDTWWSALRDRLGRRPTAADLDAESRREQEDAIREQLTAAGAGSQEIAQAIARRRWVLDIEAEVLRTNPKATGAQVTAELDRRDPNWNLRRAAERRQAEQRKEALALQQEAIQMALEDGVNQLSAAQAFAAYAPELVWADDARQWFAFDGARYRPCGEATVMGRLNDLGALFPKDRRSKEVTKMFFGGEAAGVVQRARSVVPVRLEDFDRNTNELVFRDVRLSLEPGHAQTPNGPDSYVTKALPWPLEHASDESRAAWAGFLEGTGLGSDVLEYLQRGFGAAATGLCSEKAFFYLYGESGTAKTTFVELIARALDCYCARVSSRLFMTRRKDAGGHTDDMMSLPGARLAWADETKDGDRFDLEIIKGLTAGTGAATIRLSAKGQPGRDVRVSFLMVFTSEHLVRVDAEEKGLFARQKIIKFSNVVPKDRRNPRFVEENFDLMRPAIIEWLVNGAITWLEDGLGKEPTSVERAGAENQLAQDWVGAIIDQLYERTDSEADAVPFADIRAEVAAYLKAGGRRETVTDTKLGIVLTKRGFNADPRTKARLGCRESEALKAIKAARAKAAEQTAEKARRSWGA